VALIASGVRDPHGHHSSRACVAGCSSPRSARPDGFLEARVIVAGSAGSLDERVVQAMQPRGGGLAPSRIGDRLVDRMLR